MLLKLVGRGGGGEGRWKGGRYLSPVYNGIKVNQTRRCLHGVAFFWFVTISISHFGLAVVDAGVGMGEQLLLQNGVHVATQSGRHTK